MATSTGCICIGGFKWSAGKCVPCTLGTEVNKGGSCVICTSLAISTGCSTCANANGYAKSNNVCYDCLTQYGVRSSTVTGGLCTCPSSMVWAPLAGGCVCKSYIDEGYIWTYNSSLTTANKWICQYWSWTNTGSCGYSPTKWISAYNICHLCRNDPNNAVLWNSA